MSRRTFIYPAIVVRRRSSFVVVVSLIEFWEWRLALIMALAIRDYAGDDFRVSVMLGIDLQAGVGGNGDHCSGPVGRITVVAGDGIKRDFRWPTSCDRGVLVPTTGGHLFRNAHK